MPNQTKAVYTKQHRWRTVVAAAAALLEVRQEEVVEVASALEEPVAEHVHSKQSQVAGAC